MSRVVWGHAPQSSSDNSNTKKQSTLDKFVVPVRREREVDSSHTTTTTSDDGDQQSDTQQHHHQQQQQQQQQQRASSTVSSSASSQAVMMMTRRSSSASHPHHQSTGDAEDGVLWGPAGSGNRETMKQRRARPFMNGKERSHALDQSPYSRDFMKEWSAFRAEATDPQQQQSNGSSSSSSAASTTEMDPEIICARFLKPSTPRNLFAGKVFFLNSCDSDQLVTVYQLEKIIRVLGGSTAMGVSKRVDFIVTQHVSSAKSKLLENHRCVGGKKAVAIHPHWVLSCCDAGKLVPVEKFLTLPPSTCVVDTTKEGLVSHGEEDDGIVEVVKVVDAAATTINQQQRDGENNATKRRRCHHGTTETKEKAKAEDVVEIV